MLAISKVKDFEASPKSLDSVCMRQESAIQTPRYPLKATSRGPKAIDVYLFIHIYHFIPVPFISVLLYLKWKGVSPGVCKANWPQLAAFCGCSFVNSFAPYTTVEHLPLASAVAIEFAIHNMTVPFAARIYLKETISTEKAIAVLCCTLGGAICGFGLFISGEKTTTNLGQLPDFTAQEIEELHTSIIEYSNQTDLNYNLKMESMLENQITTTQLLPSKPSGIHSMNGTISEPLTNHFHANDFAIGISLGILAGLSDTGKAILIKKLQPEVENIFTLEVYYNLTGILVSLILMLMIEFDRLSFPTDAENVIYFTIHATSKLITSFTLQLAYYYCSALICALTLNANLPLNALCEYGLFPSMQPLSGGNSIEMTGVGICNPRGNTVPHDKSCQTFVP